MTLVPVPRSATSLFGTSEAIVVGAGTVLQPPVIPPHVPACVCGITDTFTRTVSPGWGTSDSAIAWKRIDGYAPIASSYVNGSQGVLVASGGSNPSAYIGGQELDFATLADFEMTVHVAMSNTTTSSSPNSAFEFACNFGSIYVYDYGSGTNTYWNFGTASGNFSFYPWNTGFTLKVSLTSTFYGFKMWRDGGTEPAAWTVSGTPSSTPTVSFVQFWAQNDARSDDVLTIDIDNLDITGINVCTQYRFDNFDRTVASGWGTSDYGTAWTYPWGTTGLSVSGSQGVLSAATPSATVGASIVPPSPGTFDCTMRVTLPTWSGTPDLRLYILGEPGLATTNTYVIVYPVADYLTLSRQGTSTGGAFSFVAGATYLIRLVITTSETDLYVWPDGTARPSTPTYLVANAATSDSSTGSLTIDNGTYTDTSATNYLIDYIDFDYTGKPCYTTSNCSLEAWSGATTNISGSVSGQTHSTGSMSALCGTFGGSYGLQVTTSLALPVTLTANVASDTFPSGSAYSAGQFIVTSSNGQSFTVTCRLGSTGLSSISGSGGTWTGPVATSDWTVNVGRPVQIQVLANGSVSVLCDSQVITRSGTGLSDVLTVQWVVLTSVSSGYSATVSQSSITVCGPSTPVYPV